MDADRPEQPSLVKHGVAEGSRRFVQAAMLLLRAKVQHESRHQHPAQLALVQSTHQAYGERQQLTVTEHAIQPLSMLNWSGQPTTLMGHVNGLSPEERSVLPVEAIQLPRKQALQLFGLAHHAGLTIRNPQDLQTAVNWLGYVFFNARETLAEAEPGSKLMLVAPGERGVNQFKDVTRLITDA